MRKRKKGNNKVVISFYVNDSFPDTFTRIFFYAKGNFNKVRNTHWWYANKFIFDGSDGLTFADKGLYPEISDFNNRVVTKLEIRYICIVKYEIIQGYNANNKKISSVRMKEEHIIGRIKHFKMVAEKYRNKRKRLLMRFNLICGIVNFENQ